MPPTSASFLPAAAGAGTAGRPFCPPRSAKGVAIQRTVAAAATTAQTAGGGFERIAGSGLTVPVFALAIRAAHHRFPPVTHRFFAVRRRFPLARRHIGRAVDFLHRPVENRARPTTFFAAPWKKLSGHGTFHHSAIILSKRHRLFRAGGPVFRTERARVRPCDPSFRSSASVSNGCACFSFGAASVVLPCVTKNTVHASIDRTRTFDGERSLDDF